MKKILVIDDEPHVVEVIRHFLIKSGYQVDTACNGFRALEKIKVQLPDVIVTDIQMPKMGGKEFYAQLEKTYPDNEVLVVVMTAQTEREFREWVYIKQNVEFFEKPLSPRKLVACLDNYFEEMKCTG